MNRTNTSIAHVTFKTKSEHAQMVLDKRTKIPSFQQLFRRIEGYPNIKVDTRYSINCNQTMRGWLREKVGMFNDDHIEITVEL